MSAYIQMFLTLCRIKELYKVSLSDVVCNTEPHVVFSSLNSVPEWGTVPLI